MQIQSNVQSGYGSMWTTINVLCSAANASEGGGAQAAMATWAFIRHLGGERATRIFQSSRFLGAITLPSFFWPKSLFAGIDSARHTLSPLPKKFQTREDDTGEC